MPALSPLTRADLHDIRHAAEAVTLPAEITQAIQRIWAQHKETFKEDRREGLSDRRLKKLIKLLSVSAASNGRDKVDLSDVLLLKDCLWNHPDNAAKVREMVFNALRAFSRQVPQDNTLKETQPASSSRRSQENRNAAPKIKGYKGSGTADDPLLIENLHDLAGLARPEVGQQGYYFRQAADIDCSEVSAWVDIYFEGHYDGGGHKIQGNGQLSRHINSPRVFHILFKHIRKESSISNTVLINFLLAETAADSLINYLTSSVGLILGAAMNCRIHDCLILIRDLNNKSTFGGIAHTLGGSRIVENCYVNGLFEYEFLPIENKEISAIAVECHHGYVMKCAIDPFLQPTGLSPNEYRVLQTKVVSSISSQAVLKENIAKNKGDRASEPNGPFGQTLAPALFKQHYFEHTLGWDFDTVWQWDDANNRPALRPVSARTAGLTPEPAAASANTIDLLTQQIRANLWL